MKMLKQHWSKRLMLKSRLLKLNLMHKLRKFKLKLTRLRTK